MVIINPNNITPEMVYELNEFTPDLPNEKCQPIINLLNKLEWRGGNWLDWLKSLSKNDLAALYFSYRKALK